MSSFAGIQLARHGETDYNLHGRFQGWLPVPLNQRGRAQAADLASRAASVGFRELWCSPLARARETADIVAGAVGLEPRPDGRLAETETGDWTDLSFEEVRRRTPDLFDAFARGDPGFAFPGGESFVDHANRVMDGLADIARGQRPALVVCHGVVIRLALTRLGQSVNGQTPGATPMENAAMIALEDPPALPADGLSRDRCR